MQYLITFLEGLISFLSPCMLPMLPVYLSYFGRNTGGKRHALLHAAFFVLGFTVVFCALGSFAGTLGSLFTRHQTAVNLICGLIVVLFGLSYLEVLHLPFFKGAQQAKQVDGIFSALLFGMIYSISLTPCVGAFLGSALMMASTEGQALQGALLLLIYSLGLGIPFLFSAVLLEKLQTTFGFIKRHYRTINIICGVFLIIVGLAMAFGWLQALLAIFS